MENTETKTKANKEIEKKQLIKDLQDCVDLLRSKPQYAQYVDQRKLHLISGRYKILDLLLLKGILK